jgi:hypothetical protein
MALRLLGVSHDNEMSDSSDTDPPPKPPALTLGPSPTPSDPAKKKKKRSRRVVVKSVVEVRRWCRFFSSCELTSFRAAVRT